jgi:hypothetical protein
MAKDRKGKEGASRAIPRWSPPAADGITPGDILQFYSMENSFTFRVLSVQHGGEWIFGRDTRDGDESRSGPIAVKRTDCMSLETAARVLKDLPTISITAVPDPE